MSTTGYAAVAVTAALVTLVLLLAFGDEEQAPCVRAAVAVLCASEIVLVVGVLL